MSVATKTVRGRVQGGRLKVDEPTDLPEDMEVDLALVLDEGDDLDEEERTRLHASLRIARAEVGRGEVHPIEQVLAEL